MPNRRRRRRHRAEISIVVAIAILLVIAASGLATKGLADSLQSQLTSQLKAGQDELEAAKNSLKLANANHDLNQVAVAKVHFAAAQAQFNSAIRVADGNFVLRVLEAVPVAGYLAGSRHTAVDSIAIMGSSLAAAGQDLADLDGQLLKPTTSGSQEGQVILDMLNQMGKTLPKIRAELKRADDAGKNLDASVVPAAQRAALLKARQSVHSALTGIEEFEKLVPALIEILGGNGVRTYLVEQVNPAEIRPGGGFIGSFSVLRADHGSITLVKSANSYELAATRASPGQAGYVLPPGPLHEFVPSASWSFVDSNFFADFAANAKAAEQFAAPQLKTPIDAVISMDYYTVAAILKVTGPISVPDYEVTVTSDNFVPLLIKYDLDQGYTHKAILTAIAGPLFQRVLSIPLGQWPNLITTLSDLVVHRNLQIYFNNPMVAAEMDRFGWSGALNPTHATDFMMETEANLGGTKANYFVSRSYTVRLTRNGDKLHHTVMVDVTDNMPYSYHPGDYYHAYATLYMSVKSSSGSNNLTRGKYPSPSPPAGMHLLDGWMDAIPGGGGKTRALFDYDTPWQPDDQGTAHIYWQKQPGTLNDKIQVIWVSPNHDTTTVNGELGQDQVINLAWDRVTLTPGQPAKAKLPTISLG